MRKWCVLLLVLLAGCIAENYSTGHPITELLVDGKVYELTLTHIYVCIYRACEDCKAFL